MVSLRLTQLVGPFSSYFFLLPFLFRARWHVLSSTFSKHNAKSLLLAALFVVFFFCGYFTSALGSWIRKAGVVCLSIYLLFTPLGVFGVEVFVLSYVPFRGGGGEKGSPLAGLLFSSLAFVFWFGLVCIVCMHGDGVVFCFCPFGRFTFEMSVYSCI